MSSDSVCLSLTAAFTALLGVLCLGTLIMPVTVELMALLTLLGTAHAMFARMNPLDRAARTAAAVVAGMALVGVWAGAQGGDPSGLATTAFRSAGRFGLGAFLCSWTAVFSGSRSVGQYIYNLVFVSSFALLIGHVSTRLVLDSPLVGAPGAFAAWLEGGALGAAFAYVTSGARESIGSESTGGTSK